MLALITYSAPVFDDELQPRFHRFDKQEVGRYWPPERKLVDNEYRDLAFPFAEMAGPEIAIHREWNLAQSLGYVSTWSAVRNAREAGQEGLLHAFAKDFTELWGDPDRERALYWPIAMRLGRI
jgi:hypothetical protein